MKVSINIVNTIIIVLIIKVILDLFYCFYITKIWNYDGYVLEINLLKVLISYGLLFITLLISLRLYRNSELAYFMFMILIVTYLIPNLVIFGYSNSDGRIVLSLVFFMLVIAFSTFRKINLPVNILTVNGQYLVLLISAILIISLFFLRYRGNIFPKVLIFNDIYLARDYFGSNSTRLLDYLLGWYGRVIAPVAIVWGLIYRRKLLVIIAIIGLLYIYLISGHKSIFLTTFIVLFFYYLPRDIEFKVMLFFGLLIIGLLLFPVIDSLINRHLFIGIFVNRVFFIPAQLNLYYWDFFADNPLKLSHSVLSFAYDYPYELKPANLIGLEYFNRPNMHANNGVISDAFMNFGYSGVIIVSLFSGAIFSYINSIEIDERYLGVFVVFSRLFIGSGFLTIFLTHGIILLLIFNLLIMRKKAND